MKNAANMPLVKTIPERCRGCFTCVRECPAKAIRINEGQAEVLPTRCIGCGNCVRVCSQHAKEVLDSIGDVEALLASDDPAVAIIAPSFPAEFSECTHLELVGMVRALGFDRVNDVAFGADLVAERYARLMKQNDGQRYIATSCSAIVAYVERYHPDQIASLAPIVSPMIAEARVLKRMFGDTVKIVFVGPCIAKKGERVSQSLPSEVAAALTFTELRRMFAKAGIAPDKVAPSEFDPPLGGAGALFPISRGMLQAARIKEDLLDGEIVSAAGRTGFVEAIKEFETGDLDARLLEVLACSGCIDGPGITNQAPQFSRRSFVSQYVRNRDRAMDWERWQREIDQFSDLDLSRTYTPDDQRIRIPSKDELADILKRLGKLRSEDELNCGACGYDTCREHAIAIYKGLAENEMCLPYTIEELRKTINDLGVSNEQLAQTREALIHSEKLASMGQLAAGIAHELNNPLGVVLMYAHLLEEENSENVQLHDDIRMIAEQADRCKKIVHGLLHFARQNKVERTAVDLGELIETARKSAPPPEGITFEARHEANDNIVELDHDQMLQVLTNLFNNAYAAMPRGGSLSVVTTTDPNGTVRISVSDTGTGIPKGIRDRIFDPFFTTKEIGVGTGLGLAVTYGIVKMHGGAIDLVSNEDPDAGPVGTTFMISIPRQ